MRRQTDRQTDRYSLLKQKKFFPTPSVCRSVESRLTESIKTPNTKRGVKTAAKNIKTMKSACTDVEAPLCVGKNVCHIDAKSQIRFYGLSHCAPRAPNATGYSCVLLGYAP